MNNELIFKYESDGQPVELTYEVVRQFLTGDANVTLPEFRMFGELCRARRLNPFLKEAYLVKYGSKPAQLIVSKDVILKRADDHPQYDGMEDGIIVQREGGVEYRTGCCMYQGDNLIGAWARVHRKDRGYPTFIAVSFNECAGKTGDGKLNSMWATKGAMMCNKVAKTRALREAFPNDFSGMYDESEYDSPVTGSEPAVIIQDEPGDGDVVNLNDL